MINEHESLGPYGKNILLVLPQFPIPNKRKVHHDFFPIGLLKIGTYLKEVRKCNVQLTFENKEAEFLPDEVWVTSLFTYWSKFSIDSINFYKDLYPRAKFYLGGIFATLMADTIHIEGVTVQKGVYVPAEEYCKTHQVDESLLDAPLDFQIVHGMRGCFRRCKFCGTWRIEPEEIYVDGLTKIINKNHVVFYDNNLLRRPDIKDFLVELSKVRVNGKPVKYESQSGFDGRILDQEIANLLHKARFMNVRIAWDGKLSEFESIKRQIGYLCNAGYPRKGIYVFMIFNWDIPPCEMEQKRMKCWELGVQIADCRFRPLDQLFDRYSTRMEQTSRDYYIHKPIWSDETVKRFRRNIRKHNICVRHDLAYYSVAMERKSIDRETINELKKLRDKKVIKERVEDAWFPDEDHMSELLS